MKTVFLIFCCAILAGTLNEVQCRSKKVNPHPSSSPLKKGWRLGNGPCICKSKNPYKPTGHHSPHPTGHHTGHHSPHPTGHHTGHHGPHPTGHHGPHPTGHHGPHPTGHHTGHHGPHPTGHHTGHHSAHPTGHHTGHHSPHPTGHHGPHPTGHHGPHPTGHHGPHPTGHHTGHHGPHPTGHHTGHHGSHPTGHHPHPTGHHSHHPTGHHGHSTPHHGHHTGHHGPHPTSHHGHPTGHHGHSTGYPKPKGLYKPCVCGKRPEKIVNIKFRMKAQWDKQLSDIKSAAFKTKSLFIMTKIKKVLKKTKRFTAMKFSQGSIVVQFGVVYDVAKDGSITEDPGSALRNAVKNGEMKDMDIYPDSLAVSESYSGVKVGEWHSSDRDCNKGCSHHSKMVPQERNCTEIDSSCDGIPLTRKVPCQQACPLHHAAIKGFTKASKILLTVGLLVAAVAFIALFIVIFKMKKSSHKYLSTSPSTTSIKELMKNDQLDYKC